MREDLAEKWNKLPQFHKKTINALLVDLRAAKARERPARDDLIVAKKKYDFYEHERESIEAGLRFYLQQLGMDKGPICRDIDAIVKGQFNTESGEWNK